MKYLLNQYIKTWIRGLLKMSYTAIKIKFKRKTNTKYRISGCAYYIINFEGKVLRQIPILDDDCPFRKNDWEMCTTIGFSKNKFFNFQKKVLSFENHLSK